MLKLHTLAESKAADKGSLWYELSPGPDDQRSGAADGVFFWFDEWEVIGEPLIGNRLPGYDRHDRINVAEEDWQLVMAYLTDVAERLREADEPAMVHVLLPELPDKLRWTLSRQWPDGPQELANDIGAIVNWLREALRRWHSVTVIGL